MTEFALDRCWASKSSKLQMLSQVLILSLAAFTVAKKTAPVINANTTLMAARYSNNTRKFEKDSMKAFSSQVQMQQAMNPDSIKNLTKAMIGVPGLTLTITDATGNPVGEVSQMQYGSIMMSIYQMPVSVNSSKCDVYAAAKVPRTSRGGDKVSDSDLKSLIKAAKQQCQNHISALDGYTVEDSFDNCGTPQNTNSSQRLACLQPFVDKRTSFMNDLIARLATTELASGLPTDRANAEVYQQDLKNQANLEIAGDFFFGPTPLLFLSVPKLQAANKLGRELQTNTSSPQGNSTAQ